VTNTVPKGTLNLTNLNHKEMCDACCEHRVVCKLRLQNAAARLITVARRRDHITPVLCQLHWLPVRRRVEFKLACLVRQALCGQMPIYLADDIHLASEGN